MFKKLLSLLILICFFCQTVIPAQAGIQALPAPGTMVNLSPAFEPVLVKGLKVNPENPFLFDFIVDSGDTFRHSEQSEESQQEFLKSEADRLIKYFFAGLTIPEKDLWVNLSPYEKDRTVPESLSKTALGRDLLAQDYILKQLTATLIYPEKELGKAFWDKVYAKAQQLYGTSEVPVNTFNKVWIIADKATVFERNQVAYILEGHLKVMLEEDYLATEKGTAANFASGGILPQKLGAVPSTLASQIIKEIILPELEKEVNQGKNFAPLRQMYYSLILAGWFKINLKQALLNQVYSDKSVVKGLEYSPSLRGAQATKQSQKEQPKTDVEAIYQQYLQAYKKGVFNYIKEDIVIASAQPSLRGGGADEAISKRTTIPRKYFSGGVTNLSAPKDFAMVHTISPAQSSNLVSGVVTKFSVNATPKDRAMNAELKRRQIYTLQQAEELRDILTLVFKREGAYHTDIADVTFTQDFKKSMIIFGTSGFGHSHSDLLRRTAFKPRTKYEYERDWFGLNFEFALGVDRVTGVTITPPVLNSPREGFSDAHLEFKGLLRQDIPSDYEDKQWIAYQRDGVIYITRRLLEAFEKVKSAEEIDAVAVITERDFFPGIFTGTDQKKSLLRLIAQEKMSFEQTTQDSVPVPSAAMRAAVVLDNGADGEKALPLINEMLQILRDKKAMNAQGEISVMPARFLGDSDVALDWKIMQGIKMELEGVEGLTWDDTKHMVYVGERGKEQLEDALLLMKDRINQILDSAVKKGLKKDESLAVKGKDFVIQSIGNFDFLTDELAQDWKEAYKDTVKSVEAITGNENIINRLRQVIGIETSNIKFMFVGEGNNPLDFNQWKNNPGSVNFVLKQIAKYTEPKAYFITYIDGSRNIVFVNNVADSAAMTTKEGVLKSYLISDGANQGKVGFRINGKIIQLDGVVNIERQLGDVWLSIESLKDFSPAGIEAVLLGILDRNRDKGKSRVRISYGKMSPESLAILNGGSGSSNSSEAMASSILVLATWLVMAQLQKGEIDKANVDQALQFIRTETFNNKPLDADARQLLDNVGFSYEYWGAEQIKDRSLLSIVRQWGVLQGHDLDVGEEARANVVVLNRQGVMSSQQINAVKNIPGFHKLTDGNGAVYVIVDAAMVTWWYLKTDAVPNFSSFKLSYGTPIHISEELVQRNPSHVWYGAWFGQQALSLNEISGIIDSLKGRIGSFIRGEADTLRKIDGRDCIIVAQGEDTSGAKYVFLQEIANAWGLSIDEITFPEESKSNIVFYFPKPWFGLDPNNNPENLKSIARKMISWLKGLDVSLYNKGIKLVKDNGGGVDSAMIGASPTGGIDLMKTTQNTAVQKEGAGVQMTVDPAMIERVRQQGALDRLDPVIYKITPITSIWPILGLEPPKREEELAGI